jgi:phenylalanine-4-hydroxylase
MLASTLDRIRPPQAYWDRRSDIAQQAAGIDRPALDIDYTPTENEVWATVSETLAPLWDMHAAVEVLAGRDRLALPTRRIAQLSEVDAALRPLSGFGYRAVAGLVPSVEFFGGLARDLFSSTQYIRWEGAPVYTPEPDVIHEVLGHANCLAASEIAELHRLAGQAIRRVQTARARQFLADVFWFSGEFGVVREGSDIKAYGAGLLSSPGELSWYCDHAEFRPIDVASMGRLEYAIDVYQPVLFTGESMQHVLDVVGGFFATATDESIERLLVAS